MRNKSLHLDAPHGSFEVRGIAPEVQPTIDALPDGTDVECEGSFDGGGTIAHLVVTKVRRILKDMTGRVMTLSDAIVAADGRLAAARTRKHFADGNIAAAAADIGSLLRLGDDQAIAEYERLPPEHQQALLPALVEWQTPRDASARALRYIPLARWTDAHLDQAIEQALAAGGVFGPAPGMRAEDIIAELERRELSTTTRSKQVKRLRKAQSTEGDTYHRITTELEAARVIGAGAEGVYVTGTVDRRPVIVLYALDGREVKRWVGIAADRVVDGIAIRTDDDPAGVRLSDGKALYHFAHRIARHDAELLWGIHERDDQKRTMRSEIVRITTGNVMARFDEWIDDIAWDADGVTTRPQRPVTIAIETSQGTAMLPASHAPWLFHSWQSIDAGGWIVHADGAKQLYLAPSELDAAWVSIELANPASIDLAPPWLAVRHGDGEPILLIALAELMSAVEIRVDGKRFAKRGSGSPDLTVAPAIIKWYAALVAAGVAPNKPVDQRDALLFRALGAAAAVPRDALARVLPGESPCCIEHADYWVDPDDTLFADLTRILDADGVSVRELAREESDVDDDDEAETSVKLTIEVARAGKSLKRMTGWGIRNVAIAVDRLLEKLGSRLRLFAIVRHSWSRQPYLVITAEQRRALVAAGVEGISAGAEIPD